MSNVYTIETKGEVFWSKRKMDRDWKHATEYLYRDKARAKELTQAQFEKFKKNTSKKFYEIVEEAP
jgi:hypothetical protein